MRALIVASLLALIIAAPLTARAAAVLLEARGSVKVEIPNQKAPQTAAGLELPNGATIAVARGGRASVLLDSGAVDEISENTTYTVGPKAQAARRTDLGSGVALAMREISARGSSPTVHGMVKEARGPAKLPSLAAFGDGVAPIFPSSTAIRALSTITFRWDNGALVNWKAPAIVIDDAKGRRLALRPIASKSSQFEAASRELRVTPGASYSWYLASNEGSVKGRTSRTTFSVLPIEEERALDAEIDRVTALDLNGEGKAILMAQLFYGHRMLDDMVRALEPIWERSKSPYVGRMLKHGYEQMGRAKEAARIQ